ncbi:hypothetical protein IE53DRAFT_81292 [Violaceomyces palustris]|uniref:Uncharacterized protein n=1 Tax=Violaceomyces palustris TaxID=1673888 RepID=A0ACD0NYB6_9BASI|nr:hypothetical protein IE53DRAFT_81292 [Violaceomyces palustris]
MAATKVATLHPHHNPLNSQSSPFDEFLNLPPSPQLSHPSPSPLALSPPQTQSSAPSISKLATSSHHGSSIAASSSPPPPGSSPESLFRYYLAAELRKAGTNPDDALLDKYVKNHFDSLFKTKPLARSSASTIQVGGSNADPKRPATLSAPSQTPVFDQPDLISEQDVLVATDDPALQELQATSSPSLSAMSARSFTPLATPPMEELNADQLFPRAFKHSSPSLEVSTFNPMSFASTSNDVIQASNANQQPIPQPGTQQQHQPSSIDPHLVELTSVHQPFSMSRMAPLYGNPDSSKYSRNHRHSTTSDAMSEDSGDDAGEDEDDKSKLAHLVNASGSQSLSTSQFMPFKPMRLGTTAAPSEATKPTKAAASETKPVSKIISSANDLKPNPEEYKKLSSKEKRQLRNKISARNFRTRRKGKPRHHPPSSTNKHGSRC